MYCITILCKKKSLYYMDTWDLVDLITSPLIFASFNAYFMLGFVSTILKCPQLLIRQEQGPSGTRKRKNFKKGLLDDMVTLTRQCLATFFSFSILYPFYNMLNKYFYTEKICKQRDKLFNKHFCIKYNGALKIIQVKV